MKARIQPHQQATARRIAAIVFTELRKDEPNAEKGDAEGILAGITEVVLEKVEKLLEAKRLLRQLNGMDEAIVKIAKSDFNLPEPPVEINLLDGEETESVDAMTANRGHGA